MIKFMDKKVCYISLREIKLVKDYPMDPAVWMHSRTELIIESVDLYVGIVQTRNMII